MIDFDSLHDWLGTQQRQPQLTLNTVTDWYVCQERNVAINWDDLTNNMIYDFYLKRVSKVVKNSISIILFTWETLTDVLGLPNNINEENLNRLTQAISDCLERTGVYRIIPKNASNFEIVLITNDVNEFIRRNSDL